MPRPTTTGVFHQYLEMITINEPMTHRARFWSSYVRGLGGADDFIAHKEKCTKKCPASSACKSCCKDKPMREIVREPGYHYAPLYRNIYGHSPRKTGLKSIYA